MSDEEEESERKSRSRRKTAKKVNYAKEQEFSDEDIFEDSEDDQPAYRGGGRKPRPSSSRRSKNLINSLSIDDTQRVDDSGKVFYTEKGYDPSLPPLRERFPFLPEREEDGTAKIELIVGRRPVDEGEDVEGGRVSDEEMPQDEASTGKRETRIKNTKRQQKGSPQKESSNTSGPIEFEYLVKYKGRSYLHLDWLRGADLDSMNKSAKGIYRRYLKKLSQGGEEDLESPEFDPAFVVPQKILDEQEQEITVELSDKELLKWEKQREREIAAAVNEEEEEKEQVLKKEIKINHSVKTEEVVEDDEKGKSLGEHWTGEEELDYAKLPLQKLRNIINSEGPYYPHHEGSNNPYRDGYVKEAPRKPRASYLFFQGTMRSFFQKKHPGLTQSELMALMGNTWQALSEQERRPFIELAREEAKQYQNEYLLMEKAQRPSEVWQPLRRCHMVLDRLSKDSFAEIFLEAVDTNEFTDYEEIIDSPMDLSTVRSKLSNKNYQAPEQFARDMRKIWNNCKVYNMHGSAIWHVADYMSKQFERLYHAWVLEFRERYLRWAEPRARPWELSCRVHDGKCNMADSDMVLCDHCDAMYGIRCLVPPLKRVPSKAWHCPECKPKLKTVKGSRMLSAIAENAAKKRAELGDVPKKKKKQTMYLVKWSGLGYEHCTWETRVDINDNELIAAFRRLNNVANDESLVSAELIGQILASSKRTCDDSSRGVGLLSSFKSQLYAQACAFHFSRFGSLIPPQLCKECGPKSWVVENAHDRPIVECLADLIFKVERSFDVDLAESGALCLPAPLTGEYDAKIPITSKGLLMNVGEIHGSVAFLGYRQFPDGTKGPAELGGLIRGVGDKIIAVDGQSTIGKTFKDVIAMLRESGKNRFAYMRFIENKFSICDGDLASVGTKGRYAVEELTKKFTTDRQKLIVQRSQGIDTKDPEEADLKPEDVDQEESDPESEGGSEGEFHPDSEDDEQRLHGNVNEVDSLGENNITASEEKEQEKEELGTQDGEEECTTQASENIHSHKTANDDVISQHENTRSLGYRLLDKDFGYSSDEGGDEDDAFFLDGVDGTFSKKEEIMRLLKLQELRDEEIAKEATLPAKQSDLIALGDQAKLVCATALHPLEPESRAFDNYPLGSEESQAHNGNKEYKDTEKQPLNEARRSTVKVEQISTSTGDVVHVWANIEAAAATLQLRLDQLRQLLNGEYDEELGDEVGGYKWRYAAAGAKVTAGTSTNSRGAGGKKAKQAWLEFREKLYDPSQPHPYKNNNRLRDYQVDGVNWLASTWYKKQGCILADEMGLGKTVQIVCYIEHIFRVEKILRPYLVVVPLSTVEHWRREFEGWTDMICCVYHDRQRIWRDIMREYEWYYKDRPHTAEFLKFDVLVTTYDTLISDFDVVSQIPFRIAVVDEAHRLRNQKGKLLECMREISARGTMQYGFQSRVLISGTPLQNDLTELWTLLNFIEPFKFPDLDSFQANFGNMASREQVENLQRMISPYMLRRVKEDVAKDIPAKEETVIDVELTSIQKQYYRAIFEHNHAFLSMGASRNSAPKLMNIQMELRKVCNHPYLLEGVEHRESEKLFKEFLENGSFEGKSAEDQQYQLNEHGYIMTSGKMVLLDKLLPKLRTEGHKVLIFSQMVKMLDLLAEYCEFRNFRFERLDGRIRGAERQKAIDRFEREEDSFIFMLSTRAGGVGINLTAADICIIFDSDWNPQNDIQAQARCHRIGQSKEVKVFRLVTSRSFEQEMFERASKKLGLEQAVLGTFEKEREDEKPSQKEMEQLLKKGAYALLEDDNDAITKEFCTDDIDAILAKRTRTRVVEGAKTAGWLNKQGMVFSKSRFASEVGGEDLDMDDPLFWQKVMPDFVTPSLMMQKLTDLTDDIEGKVRGPGRGRGRKKRPGTMSEKEINEEYLAGIAMDEAEKEDVSDDHDDDGETLHSNPEELPVDDEEDEEEERTVQLSRTNVRKVHKFMSELKSMMQGILDEEDEEGEGLSSEEKYTCQKMLLTVTVKINIFNETQRREARQYLKRMEGDRRRRCRTSEQMKKKTSRIDNTEEVGDFIPEELRIVGRKKKKRKKREEMGEEEEQQESKRHKRSSGGEYIGEDGYLHHSDSEADWSDIGEDPYTATNKKKDTISRKESRRRRTWAADDDAATAAGRAWPVFPRHVVKKILTTVLVQVMKKDDERGGVFSRPVSKEEFPEYYEQIQKPMDYGTMKQKLENNEYRSAQAMQKDFVLIVQNCRTFNDPASEIVKEARQQHLMRPSILKEAAARHDLFLAEDGSVLEIVDETKSEMKGSKGKKKVKGNQDDNDVSKHVPQKNKKIGKEKAVDRDETDTDESQAITEQVSSPLRKPRIRIKVKPESLTIKNDESKGKRKMTIKRKRTEDKEAGQTNGEENDALLEQLPKKGKKKESQRARVTKKKQDNATVDRKKSNAEASKREKKDTFFNLSSWKKSKASLDGSFKAARDFLTSQGPWELPAGLPADKFVDVAKDTLARLKKIDRYSVFAEPVTEDEAPKYFEIVQKPMDFATMREKVNSGDYGTGTAAATKFFKDLLLIFDNCFTYNDEKGGIAEEAIRVMGLVPEAYVSACLALVKKSK